MMAMLRLLVVFPFPALWPAGLGAGAPAGYRLRLLRASWACGVIAIVSPLTPSTGVSGAAVGVVLLGLGVYIFRMGRMMADEDVAAEIREQAERIAADEVKRLRRVESAVEDMTREMKSAMKAEAKTRGQLADARAALAAAEEELDALRGRLAGPAERPGSLPVGFRMLEVWESEDS